MTGLGFVTLRCLPRGVRRGDYFAHKTWVVRATGGSDHAIIAIAAKAIAKRRGMWW